MTPLEDPETFSAMILKCGLSGEPTTTWNSNWATRIGLKAVISTGFPTRRGCLPAETGIAIIFTYRRSSGCKGTWGMRKRRCFRKSAVIANVRGFLFFLSLTICPASGAAEEVRVAVATNFLATLNEIATNFERDTGHTVLVSSGSSGKLYAQIKNGAPFDVLFSADVTRPRLLEEENVAVQGSRFTYAVGRLTLWSSGPTIIEGNGKAMLLSDEVEHVAVANPKTAPYGAAAKEALEALGLWEQVQDRLVRGENIGQTFHFVFSRNAQLGFVALSQVLAPKVNGAGSRWDVPVHLYAPIRQQAVLLLTGQRHEGARAFLEYVKEATARDIIERFGYGLE